MLSLSGHIGTKASALVDGQLSPSEEERAWSHVLTCPGCRRAVEHEGWVKRQLGSLSGAPLGGDPTQRLLGSLYAVDAWAQVDEIERRSVRRRTTAVLVGGGAVSACVLGILAVTGAPTARTDVPPRPSPANISGELPGRTTPTAPTGTETTRPPALARRSR